MAASLAIAELLPVDLPTWVESPFGVEATADPDEQIDSEVAFDLPSFAPSHERGLPQNPFEVAGIAGAPLDQIRKAEEMKRNGLDAAARRQALCGVLGMRQDCSSSACGQRLYTPFRCKCRYCLTCAGVVYSQLFRKYVALRPVTERLVSGSGGCVVAKLDFTTRNLGRMPTRDEVRVFNACIKRFLRIMERELDITRKEYGLVYCDEFGGSNNTNLHAHAVYVGPRLPRPKVKGTKTLGQLALWWKKACEGTVYHGSYIISVKAAKSFEGGLAHALKYAGKFLSKDPVRLAELELAFHGVRRVHTLGAFYNAAPKTKAPEDKPGPACPDCGSALLRVGPWLPLCVLKREGRRDLDELRRAKGRTRVLGGFPDG
jgi:hypothetical protein